MDKTIIQGIIDQGYERWENPYTYVLYKQSAEYLNVVNIIGIQHDSNPSVDQIGQIKQYVQQNIPYHDNTSIRYLVIILDDGANKEILRLYTEQIDKLWIVNMKEGQLIIYENQSTDFDGLYEVVDRCIQAVRKEQINTPGPHIGLVTFVLILINIAAYIILAIGGDVYDPNYMFEHGASMWAAVIYDKEYYRLFTSMFMHFGVEHLINNMLSLWLWGSKLEQMLGKLRYLVLYLASGLIGGLASVIMNMWVYKHLNETIIVAAGASGAIYGIMGGVLFGVLVDKNKRRYFTKQRVGLLFAISIVYMFTETGVDHTAHAGGFIGGFLICLTYFVVNHLRGKKL